MYQRIGLLEPGVPDFQAFLRPWRRKVCRYYFKIYFVLLHKFWGFKSKMSLNFFTFDREMFKDIPIFTAVQVRFAI